MNRLCSLSRHPLVRTTRLGRASMRQRQAFLQIFLQRRRCTACLLERVNSYLPRTARKLCYQCWIVALGGTLCRLPFRRLVVSQEYSSLWRWCSTQSLRRHSLFPPDMCHTMIFPGCSYKSQPRKPHRWRILPSFELCLRGMRCKTWPLWMMSRIPLHRHCSLFALVEPETRRDCSLCTRIVRCSIGMFPPRTVDMRGLGLCR